MGGIFMFIFSLVLFVIAGYVHQNGNPSDWEYLSWAALWTMLAAIYISTRGKKN